MIFLAAVQQLTRFQLMQRVARFLCGSGPSCSFGVAMCGVDGWAHAQSPPRARWKSKTGRQNQNQTRQNASVIGCATRPVLIVTTCLRFATRLWVHRL